MEPSSLPCPRPPLSRRLEIRHKPIGDFRVLKGSSPVSLKCLRLAFDPLILPRMNKTHVAGSLEGQNRLPLSDTQYVVLPLLAMALLAALRPGWPVRVGAVLLHVLWTFNATKYSAGGGYEDYMKGSFLGSASLMTLYNLVLTDPMVEWRHNSRPDVRATQLPLWERVYWVFCAAFNNRGLGWSFEVSLKSVFFVSSIRSKLTY